MNKPKLKSKPKWSYNFKKKAKEETIFFYMPLV